ncbi:hypothetical protein LIA77_11458 [Sarocladium implicatum]|nr:hypothetical protein LIA77_11458 [Sarocladium implicatum]
MTAQRFRRQAGYSLEYLMLYHLRHDSSPYHSGTLDGKKPNFKRLQKLKYLELIKVEVLLCVSGPSMLYTITVRLCRSTQDLHGAPTRRVLWAIPIRMEVRVNSSKLQDRSLSRSR